MENPTEIHYILIESKISTCEDCIVDLQDISLEQSPSWFQKLCLNVVNLIGLISKYVKEKNEEDKEKHQDIYLFFLTQLFSSTSFLCEVFKKEQIKRLILSEARRHIQNRLIICFDKMKESLTTNNALPDSTGSFIKWMDSALDKMCEVNLEVKKEHLFLLLEEAKLSFEEVLSQAMSIAQVALDDDYKSIRGASQLVLESLESLSNELEKNEPNAGMVNLFADASGDKLCALERVVDIAVLKLSLKTFSQYVAPLEAIFQYCDDQNSLHNDTFLIDLVAKFDLHVDRIMQIGLFAVSCSTDRKSSLRIRSSLANLESLECELVPAFRLLLNDKSSSNLQCALLYKKYWTDEANDLKNFIYRIIDAFTFCEIIYEQVRYEILFLSQFVINKKSIDKAVINRILSYGTVLLDFVSFAVKEIDPSKYVLDIRQNFLNCKKVLFELQSSVKILAYTEDNNARILKRCKIFRNEIKKLWMCFGKNSKSEETGNLVASPEKLSEELQIGPVLTGNLFLDHIIEKGKYLLETRSILYKTPKTKMRNIPSETLGKSILQKTFSSRRRIFSNSGYNSELSFEFKTPVSKTSDTWQKPVSNNTGYGESSLDLQITAILNELSNLSVDVM